LAQPGATKPKVGLGVGNGGGEWGRMGKGWAVCLESGEGGGGENRGWGPLWI